MEQMRVREIDRIREDLRNYGFVPNRARALRELHPPLERVLKEGERVVSEGRVGPGPSPSGRAS